MDTGGVSKESWSPRDSSDMGPRQRGQLVETQLLGHSSQWAETPGQPRVGLNPG